MENPEGNNEKITPKQLIDEIKTVKTKLISLHSTMVEKTSEVGYALDAIDAIETNYTIINNNADNFPEVHPVIASGYYQVNAIGTGTDNILSQVIEPFRAIRDISYTISTTCSTSGSVAGTISPAVASYPDIPSFLRTDGSRIAVTFATLDPALESTYRQIEQVYYGTNADNLRTSLMVTRQTFDHFFEKLAPDDDVRKSPYWRQKKGEENEMLVTRNERVIYAINTHVKNMFRAQTLLQNQDNIIKSYKTLNELHTRGHVNLNAAKEAMFAVKHYLEEFAEAIDY